MHHTLTTETLPNGLQFLHIDRPGLARVGLVVGVRCGALDDPPRARGTAHLIEHMLFRGHGSAWGAPCADQDAASERCSKLHTEVLAATGPEDTIFYAGLPRDQAVAVAQLLADMVQHPTFQDYATERAVVLREIDDVRDRRGDFLSATEHARYLALGPWTGGDNAGTPASVRRIALPTVVAQHARYYRPDRMVVACAGDLDGAVVNMIRGVFGQIPPRREPLPPPARVSLSRHARPRIARSADADPAHLALTFPFAYPCPDPVLDVFNALLDEGPGMPLWQRLRTTGLAYDFGAAVHRTTRGGDVGFDAAVAPARLPDALHAFLDLCAELRAGALPPATLARAQSNVVDGCAAYDDGAVGLARWYAADALRLGVAPTLASVAADVQRVTIADVAEHARRMFDPSRACLAVAGDVSRSVYAALAKSLHLAARAPATRFAAPARKP